MTTENETASEREIRVEFVRVMPLVYPLVLWALCREIVRGAGNVYVTGLIDGAFLMLVVRGIGMLAASYAAAGGQVLSEARKGVVIGVVAAFCAIVLMCGGIIAFRI